MISYRPIKMLIIFLCTKYSTMVKIKKQYLVQPRMFKQSAKDQGHDQSWDNPD